MTDSLATAIARAMGVRVFDEPTRIGGGSIHEAFAYRTEGAPLFVKVCDRASADMLEVEAAGLRSLSSVKAIRVPEVLAVGHAAERAFLCLEWLELSSATSGAEVRLGEQLAALHAHTSNAHGWHRDNFIGRTPQQNDRSADWVEFFRDRRLKPQLELAARNGADAAAIDGGYRLCESLAHFFTSYQPKPSLLHGDLWGGNWGALRNGEPVIFDPAVYYGDRETDLAMTRLFGGFGAAFYRAYEASWPLDVGAQARVSLYNLYHVLNHFNLFRGGYLGQARAAIGKLLAAAN